MFRFNLLLIYRAVTRRFRRLAIAFLGVAVAIASLVLLESIMEGVGDSMVDNTVAIHHGHVACNWRGQPVDRAAIEAVVPDAAAVLRRKVFSGTLQGAGASRSLGFYGVEPRNEAPRTIIAGKIGEGRYLSRRGELILGVRLARQLGASVGDELSLTVPGAELQRLRLVGLYHTGIELLDANTAYVFYDDAPGDAHQLAIFLPAGTRGKAAATQLAARHPELNAVPWNEEMAELVQLITLNHVAMNIVLLLALVILAFGISNTVYISITERIREYGILRAMGMTPFQIQRLVVAEVMLLIGVAGVLGLCLGASLAYGLSFTGLDLGRWTSENPHFLSSSIICPRLTLRSILLPGLAALVCSLLSAWLPSRKAGKITVIEALRTL